jgi:hypothetical protein
MVRHGAVALLQKAAEIRDGEGMVEDRLLGQPLLGFAAALNHRCSQVFFGFCVCVSGMKKKKSA